MSAPRIVRLYMEEALRRSAETGSHNFIAKMVKVLETASFRVEFSSDLAVRKDRFSLSHMAQPPGSRGLVFRRVYHYPFWQIDQIAERWDWDTAKAEFNPDRDTTAVAQKFYRFWGDLVDCPKGTGFVYVPLQGRLLEHRSFQKCSPIAMVEHCLENMPDRPMIVTLHPEEDYTCSEIALVQRLAALHPRLSIQNGEMKSLLRDCDCVVTQNSSVAFNGYFFGKPALLFAEVDFHHIAVFADLKDVKASFARLETHRPDYAGYIHWFWQLSSINAGHVLAEQKIEQRLRRFGWLAQ